MEEKEKIEVQLAKISDEIKKLNSKLIRAKYYRELQQAEAEKLRLIALLNDLR